jgi:hypothetical protein
MSKRRPSHLQWERTVSFKRLVRNFVRKQVTYGIQPRSPGHNSLSCRRKSEEAECHGSLVHAFNHALRDLREIEVPLRKSNDDVLLFRKNDPKQISALRKPDIILVSSEGDSFSAVELRRIKAELPAPPEKYTVKSAKMIPPQPLPTSMHEICGDLHTRHEGTRPSNDTGKSRMTTSF